MKIKYSILFIFLFAAQGALIAQNKNLVKTSAIICGTSDSAESMDIIFFTNNLVSNQKFATTYNTAVIDHNFKIKLPAVKMPTYITIVFNYPYRFNTSLQQYLIEPGDSINLSESPRAFHFNGKSSAKFLCQYLIEQVKPRMSASGWHKSKTPYQDLTWMDLMMDTICADRLKILSSFNPDFGATVYELLRLDCIHAKPARFYATFDTMLRLMRNDSSSQKEAIRYYLDHYTQKPDTTNAIVASRSYKFIDHLVRKAIVEGALVLNGNRPAVYNFRSLIVRAAFNEINANYSGILKEYLFTNFFNTTSRLDSVNDCLANAAKQVKQPYLRGILVGLQRKSIGVPAYNFSLPDSNGKKVTLSDYKGKVVVVDFWFTGCEWCILMASTLKIVSAAKDTNVVFITVCVEKNKKIWKENLKRGIFTSPNEINLYTGGMAEKHPLIDFYKIAAYPFLLIIDQAGKLFAVNPELGFGVADQSKNLPKLISAVLKEKS